MKSEDKNRKWDSLGVNGILKKPDLPRLVQIVGEDLSGNEKQAVNFLFQTITAVHFRPSFI